MVKSYILEKTGSPEVLKISDEKRRPLKEGEVRIKNHYIGLNFLDIRERRGDKKIELPTTLGYEGVGEIIETKGDVGELEEGYMVAYATGGRGAYSEEKIIDYRFLLGIPPGLKHESIAAILFKGLTAHYLTRRCYYVDKGVTILVHAAAGGVGMLITQMAKHFGAKVIGTVGSDEKIEIAKKNGCSHVINYSKDDFQKKIIEITKDEGVHVVYDSVGESTLLRSLYSIMPYGLMVHYGNASGKPKAIDTNILTHNSIFLTSPSLFRYKENRMELILSAAEVFEMLIKGHIKDNINMKYNFGDIATAHHDIENRLTVGSNIVALG